MRELLGDDPDLAGLAALVRARTSGNPFFIEEAVRALVDEGVLAAAQPPRRFVLARPIAAIRIPVSVQVLLAARIDRLPEQQKALLQTAAVIGKRFSAPLLRRVLEELSGPDAGTAVGASLEDLVRQELVDPTGPADDYAFKHPLTLEVAYRAQLADRRARAHAAVAGALHATHEDRLDEHAAVLAHHWEAAGEALEAARWHRRAAEWIGSKDRRESTRHWKTVCTLLEAVEPTPETAEIGSQARYRRLLNAVYLGQPDDEQHQLFAEGRALAVEHGGVQQVVLMSLSYAVARVFAGAVRDGVRELREAVRMADESGDATLRFVTRAILVNPLQFNGRLHEALALSGEALALSGDDVRLGADVLGFSPYVNVVLIRSVLLTHTGHLDAGARELARGRELAIRLDDAEALGTAHVFAILCAQASGRVEHVLDDARVALELAERRGSPFFRAGAHSALGYAHRLLGQWADGARALEHGLEIVAERRTGAQIEPSWLASLADTYRELGDHERATVTAERALRLARERATDVFCIEALLALARVRRAAGLDVIDATDALLTEAAALVDATGALNLSPVIDLERAEVARVGGDAAARRRALQSAHRGFASIGATGHAERVARLLA